MNRCAKNGCLVDRTFPLPTDPTELYVARLPPIGCSRLRCTACGVAVRNAVGIAFMSRDDLPRSELSKLYDLADLSSSPLLGKTHPDHRLYLCRCHRWLEIRYHELDNPDRDLLTDPDVPWRCDGHPAIEFPHDIHGVRVGSRDELRDLAVRGFHGFDPPGIRADERDAQWLTRLYYRLSPTDAGIVAQVATACLADPEPLARQRALHFYDDVRDSRARDSLVELLHSHRALFAGVPDNLPLHQRDTTLEHTAWRILRESVANPGPARDLARADGLAGRASRALYDALCRADTQWVTEHAEDLARAAPNRVEDLETSFQVVPGPEWFAKLTGRARRAVGRT